jgi:iron complex transport system substrate-binding protein
MEMRTRFHSILVSLVFIGSLACSMPLVVGAQANSAPGKTVSGTQIAVQHGLPISPDGTLALPLPANFSIQYRDGYKMLTVKSPWPGNTHVYTYVLYPRKNGKPGGIKADRFIATPVLSVVSFSTSYIPALDAIGELDSLTGVDSKDYVYNAYVQKRIAEGKIVETTKNWTPDIERMIALNPDVIFTFGMGNEWDTAPKMEEAGLPVVFIGEWNEADPLARTQWMVFIAAFYDKEAEALQKFGTIAASYSKLAKLAANETHKPRILTDGPFNGTWSVAGGGSYMAKMIADAGGRYLWADNPSTGSLQLSIEAVFQKAVSADIWINPSLAATKLSDVSAMDSRFAQIPCLQKGDVWNNNTRLSPGGGNDYFESGVMHPDLVLADMVAIFHPKLLPNHSFVYYRKLGK